jgi:hypothetical protein
MKTIISIIAISVALVSAQTTTTTHTQAEIDAHRAKVEQALTARDYASWKAEHDAFKGADSRLDGKVTAENFDKFARMVEARKSGDMATAQALRTELGIQPSGQGMGRGQGKGMGKGKGGCNGTGAGAGAGQGMQNCQRRK